jgi:hypothetical protein
VGALVGILAVLEAPVLLVVSWGYRWVRDVDERLDRIEARSKQFRRDDPEGGPTGWREE